MRLPIFSAAALTLLLASGAAYAGQDPAATAVATDAKPAKPKMICKRLQESGSLAKRTRLCYTKEQWDKLAQDQRSNSPGMSAMSGSTSGN